MRQVSLSMPCTHATSTRQVLMPSVQNGKETAPSSCLKTQVSSKPSRVRATCSTLAPQLYHIWKHAVPAASAVSSLCPATHQSALRHSPRCAAATPSTCTDQSPSPPAVGSRECWRQPCAPSPVPATDSTLGQAGTGAEQSCQA